MFPFLLTDYISIISPAAKKEKKINAKKLKNIYLSFAFIVSICYN